MGPNLSTGAEPPPRESHTLTYVKEQHRPAHQLSRPFWLVLVCAGLSLAACEKSGGGESGDPLSRESLGLPEHALGALRLSAMTVGGIEIVVEVAVEPKEQAQGLMYRTSLPENHGMLFVYRQEDFLSFWMKNTRLPLSIAFIRADGTIDVIRDMEPFDERTHHYSVHRCLYALEMPQGWFDTHSIKSGDTVTLPPEAVEP